eukprot:scaffold1560_cov177-Ochromonas_danica.AAC.8
MLAVSELASPTEPSLPPTILIETSTFRIFHSNPSVESKKKKNPPIIFLPGLDGLGDYSASCYSQLQDDYDCWRLQVDPNDRSSFLTIAKKVLEAIKKFPQPPILIGESFGGLVATYLASRHSDTIDSIVLVNPATSVDRSLWRNLAPYIASTGPLYPAVGISTLVTSGMALGQVFNIVKNAVSKLPPNPSIASAADAIMQQIKPLFEIPYALPPETLVFRMKEWLEAGSFLIQDTRKVSSIRVPVLLLIGSDDRILPSAAEGQREFHAFRDLVLRRQVNSLATDFPTSRELQDVERLLGPIFKASGVVFFSTDKDGSIHEGIDYVPTGQAGRPVLFVGNHQLLGLDMSLLVKRFIDEKKVLIRGLAHPATYQTLSKFGALLRNNETVLLYPGGAKEALHFRGEEYKLFWPERTDFVRMAAQLDAIIVPVAAIGAAESAAILFDAEEMQRLWPKLRDDAVKRAKAIPHARPEGFTALNDTSKANDVSLKDLLIPPLVAPIPPSRFYFLFMKPFDTQEVGGRSKKEAKILYQEIQSTLETGIQSLLKYREYDENKNFWPRIVKEVVSGNEAPHPSAALLEEILVADLQNIQSVRESVEMDYPNKDKAANV